MIVKVMVYDTETNGLPKNWKKGHRVTENWPEPVSVAWSKMTFEIPDPEDVETGQEVKHTELAVHNNGIKYSILRRDDLGPEDWDQGAMRVHGISYYDSIQKGKSRQAVLADFLGDAEWADLLCCHNADFDRKIMSAEIARFELYEKSDWIANRRHVCTMKQTSYQNGKKWPKLDFLHKRLFGKDFVGAHTAAGVVSATCTVLYKLVKLDDIKLGGIWLHERKQLDS
jgi:DNA polymerase III epsilon subunit-like protein